MAGYEVVKVGTADDGGVDLDDLRAKADDDVACLMLTNPNTLGLFDRNIEEIAKIVHDVGGDALLRRREPERGHGHLAARRHGLRHRPLQPAQDVHAAARRRRSGRRPDRGVGPHRAVPAGAAGGAPRAARTAAAPHSSSTTTGPKSIGKLRGFQGNFGVFVRSYAYICSLGGGRPQGGLGDRGAERELPEGAAGRGGIADYLPIAFDRTCMHEFVLSGRGAKEKLGIKTLDIAKRLLDHGVHPPTVYFPLLVDEALMIEPTETETEGAPRPLRRRGAGDPRRGRRGPGDRAQRAVHDAGAPARRGGGREAPGRALAGAGRSTRDAWTARLGYAVARRGTISPAELRLAARNHGCRSRRCATTSRPSACTTC